jgi:hypothetical protein
VARDDVGIIEKNKWLSALYFNVEVNLTIMRQNLDLLLGRLLGLEFSTIDNEAIREKVQYYSQWAAVINRAFFKKVAGSLYHCLKTKNLLEALPEDQIFRLQEESRRINLFNLFNFDVVENILKEFEEEKIRALIFKGVPLSLKVYPSISMRSQGDTDLVFLSERERKKAKNILRSKGYKVSPFYPDLLIKERLLNFDLHRDIVASERISSRKLAYSLDKEKMFYEGRAWEEGYDYIKIPSSMDHLLILAFHNEKHSYRLISGFLDVAQLVHKEKVGDDFDLFMEKAREANLTKPLRICFKYIKSIFNFPLNREMLSFVDNEGNSSVLEKKCENFILSGGNFGKLGSFLPVFSIKENKDKIKFTLESIFPSRQVMTQVTGSQKAFFTYVVRFIQALFSAVRAIITVILILTGKNKYENIS